MEQTQQNVEEPIVVPVDINIDEARGITKFVGLLTNETAHLNHDTGTAEFCPGHALDAIQYELGGLPLTEEQFENSEITGAYIAGVRDALDYVTGKASLAIQMTMVAEVLGEDEDLEDEIEEDEELDEDGYDIVEVERLREPSVAVKVVGAAVGLAILSLLAIPFFQ